MSVFKAHGSHSPEKTHKCNYCEKMFHREGYLKNHLHHATTPTKGRSEMWRVRPRATTPAGLQAAPAPCTRPRWPCLQGVPVTFESTGVLLEHLKSHSGQKSAGGVKEKKHPCEHCDRHRFYTRKGRRHMVVHTGRKDFLCQYCAQSWTGPPVRGTWRATTRSSWRSKTEPRGLPGSFTCNVGAHQGELLPVMSLPSSELLSKPFPSTLQLNLYNLRSSLCRARALPTRWSPPCCWAWLCPIDWMLSPLPTTLSFKYPFSSTSCAISIPEKEQPWRGDWKLPDGAAGRRAPPPQDSPASCVKLGLEPQLGSLEDSRGTLSCPKAPSPSVTP